MTRIFLTTALFCAALHISAQENIITQMEAIKADKSVSHLSSTIQQNNETGLSYCKYEELSIPRKHKKLITDLEEAFKKDKDKGYQSYIKVPDSSTDVGMQRILYGANNQQEILFGSHKDRSYYSLSVTDQKDSTRRHVYAIVWYPIHDTYRCLLYHIYGEKPEKKTSLSASLLKIPRAKTTYKIDSDGSATVITESDSPLKRKLSTFPSVGTYDIKTDIDFMQRFGTLRSALIATTKDTQEKSLMTGIAVNILELCKQHNDLLTPGEKTTCTLCLQELMKNTSDTFINGMLAESIKHLEKK